MSQRTLKFHGGTAAACVVFAAAIAACLGDDSTPGSDAGADHSSTGGNVSPDAHSDTSTTGTGGNGTGGNGTGGTGTGGTAGGGTGGSMAVDASDGRAGDARADATPDAPRDVTTTSDASTRDVTPDNVSTPDVAADVRSDVIDAPTSDGNDGAVPPLRLCRVLDQMWGIETDAGGCDDASPGSCPDRGLWGSEIAQNYVFFGPSNDCHINAIYAPIVGDDNAVLAHIVDLTNFVVDFFGCHDPRVGQFTGLTLSLIPFNAGLDAQVFTTADLQLLTDSFVELLVATAAAPSTGPGGTFTSQQLAAIQAQLAQVAATRHPVTSSSYSLDSCASDGGTD
jgi:hypothetical protein